MMSTKALGTNSAGLSVRFVTDARSISVRWKLTRAELAMEQMPATGVSGVDLYVKNDAGSWRQLGVGYPNQQDMTAMLASEFMLYFPLYNGVSSMEIGIPAGAMLGKAEPRPASVAKPIVFYGTSIMQGGCASRPDMALPAILGRRLNRPTINLGFTSNGRMDPEVATLLGELNAAVFVIDCPPNMSAAQVAARAGPLIATIRPPAR
jgi:hypothetical protein